MLAKIKPYGKACTHVQAFFIRSYRCGKKIIYPRIGAYFTALSGRTGAKRLSVLELSLDNTEEKEEISS